MLNPELQSFSVRSEPGGAPMKISFCIRTTKVLSHHYSLDYLVMSSGSLRRPLANSLQLSSGTCHDHRQGPCHAGPKPVVARVPLRLVNLPQTELGLSHAVPLTCPCALLSCLYADLKHLF